MFRLVLLLLGVDYLRDRWRGLLVIGCLWLIAGVFIFIDALDGALYFPIAFFAYAFLAEGLATLAVAWTGIGGQRVLRYVKGIAVIIAGGLILLGPRHGHFILSMIFGTLFLIDGIVQSASAYVVRYRRWGYALAGGIAEILLAIFFYQPYPTHYAGTLPYCLGLFLAFGGIHLIILAIRVRHLVTNPAFARAKHPAIAPEIPADAALHASRPSKWDGPPADHEHALTVHIWTPAGSSKAPVQRQPIIDRYIAAVDVNGAISTGHAALESPEGIYISLYPSVEIDRSPEELTRVLRATPDNNLPGIFQPDYATESKAWRPSTRRVRIRNYDPEKLRRYWEQSRNDATYNLTYRNCSSTVSQALEAALDGAVGRLQRKKKGSSAFVRMLTTPELWVAAQIRKRAVTMAWTPGLMLDYARALSMLADPRPSGWWKMARFALAKILRFRRVWRKQDDDANAMKPPGTA